MPMRENLEFQTMSSQCGCTTGRYVGTGKHHLNLCYEIMLERGEWVDDVVCVGKSFKPLEKIFLKSIPKREMSAE